MSNTDSRITIINFSGTLCLKLSPPSEKLVRTQFNIPFDAIEPSDITLTVEVAPTPLQIALSYTRQQRGVYTLLLDPSTLAEGFYDARLSLDYGTFTATKDLKVRVIP